MTMEKLLHERLRELHHGAFLDDLGKVVGLDAKPQDELLGDYFDKIIPALADEIERYYAPYLRDENGEPVPFGTEIEWADFTTRKMTGFGVMPNGQPYVSCWNDGLGMDDVMLPLRGYLKRPTPKVYDADGVELKVGDTVWHIATNNEFIVESLPVDDRTNLLLRGNVGAIGEITTSWYAPHEVTHERPVFDAEGVRICKGDKVWTKESEDSGTVEIVPYNDDRVLVAWGHPYGRCAEKPSELFHHVPDSLEKVRDFARAHAFKIQDASVIREIDRRLTALIERDAK